MSMRLQDLLSEERINDGLWVNNNGELVRTKDDPETDVVPVDDDGSKRVKKLQGISVFGAYRIMPKTIKKYKEVGLGKEMVTDMTRLRHAIKNPRGSESAKIVEDLVEKSIQRLLQQIYMGDVTVLVPLGSSSKLNQFIARKLKARLPKAVILEDFIKKDTWKNVVLSPTWHHELQINGGVPREGLRRAQVTLANRKEKHPDKEFEVKQFERGMRRYFSSFYKTDTGRDVDAINLLQNATILVIDDTMEEGVTMTESVRVIKKFEPKKIYGYIFLQSSHSGI